MICDDLSYTHEGVPDRFKTIKYYGFTSSYQIQLYPYSFIFHQFHYKKKSSKLFQFFFNLLKVVTDLYLLGPV